MTATPSMEIQYVDVQTGTVTYEGLSLLQDLAAGTAGGGLADGNYIDVTASGGGTVITINSGVVSLAKMANIATDRFIGRDTAGTGVPEALTATQAKSILAYTLDEMGDPVASVEFAQQQALQFVIENRTSDPGSPVSGQIWLRTDL